MKSINGFRKGFTFMELLVVIAVLAVLTAIVAAAVTGAKSTGTDGQVKSDAKATETALDNYNNKSIRTGQFPDTAITDTTTRYEDVVDVGNPTASGDNVSSWYARMASGRLWLTRRSHRGRLPPMRCSYAA